MPSIPRSEDIDKTGGLPHNRRTRAEQEYTNKSKPKRKRTNPPRA